MSLIGHNANKATVNSLTPEQKLELKNLMEELDNSYTRIAAERELQKEAFNAASEKYGLDKKLLRRMAKAHHKANFKDVVEEDNTFHEFYEVIMNKLQVK